MGECGGGRPGLPVPNSPYSLCGCKATLEEEHTSLSSHLPHSQSWLSVSVCTPKVGRDWDYTIQTKVAERLPGPFRVEVRSREGR